MNNKELITQYLKEQKGTILQNILNNYDNFIIKHLQKLNIDNQDYEDYISTAYFIIIKELKNLNNIEKEYYKLNITIKAKIIRAIEKQYLKQTITNSKEIPCLNINNLAKEEQLLILEDSFEREMLYKKIMDYSEFLHPSDKYILLMYFGLENYDKKSIDEISKIFNVCGNNISAHLKRGIRKIKSIVRYENNQIKR